MRQRPTVCVHECVFGRPLEILHKGPRLRGTTASIKSISLFSISAIDPPSKVMVKMQVQCYSLRRCRFCIPSHTEQVPNPKQIPVLRFMSHAKTLVSHH